MLEWVKQNHAIGQYFCTLKTLDHLIKQMIVGKYNHAPAFYPARWLAKAAWHV